MRALAVAAALGAWVVLFMASIAQAHQNPGTLDVAHKGLSMGALRHARLVTLPRGVLLRAGKLTITQAQLAAEIRKAGAQAAAHIKGHEIVFLENMATRALLKAEAQAWAAKSGSAAAKQGEDRLIGAYLQAQATVGPVSDAEMKAFYAANRDMFGGASYDSVSGQLRDYLSQMKRRDAIMARVSGLGHRHVIEIDSAWCAAQAKTVLNNPVDRARRTGKPALVDFGSKGCGPCDMLAPILEDLKKTYAGKCQVLVVQVREQPILASRYGVESIPVQVFFNAKGDEVFRHVGFWPKDKLIAKLAEIGVK
jgi:thiol-disulfide isomerase/thioredoxin